MTRYRLLCLATVLLLAGSANAALPNGIIVYANSTDLTSGGQLRFVTLSNGSVSTPKTLTTTSGKDIRISPDGKYVVFHNSSGLQVCRLAENAAVKSLGAGSHGSWVTKSDGMYLFYSSQSCKCSFGTGASFLRKIDLSTLTWAGTAKEVKYGGRSSAMKGGMSSDGKYASTGYPDCVIALADGSTVKTISGGQRCNPSTAPTTGRMMILDDTGHKTIGIYGIDGSSWRWSPGTYAQNPEWSTHEDYCTYVAGDHSGGNMYVGDIKNKQAHLVLKAGCTFPHLWVGTAAPSKPALSTSSGALDFYYTVGGTAPASQTLTATVSSGTLPSLTATESADWLTVTVSGSTLSNTVKTTGLAAGTVSTTVTVSGTGVDPATYTVRLTITTAAIASISITPSSAQVQALQTQQFTAVAKDQSGAAISPQPSITWQATGGGTVSNSGLFTAGSAAGTATVTAAAGGKSAVANVTITASTATITILSPTPGQTYQIGRTMSIKWSASDPTIEDVLLELSVDNGMSFMQILSETSIDRTMTQWGNYTWTIPATLQNGTKTVSLVSATCRLRIVEYSGSRMATSGTFKIEGPMAATMAGTFARSADAVLARGSDGSLVVKFTSGSYHEARITDLRGAVVWRVSSSGPATFRLAAPLAAGANLLSISSGRRNVPGHTSITVPVHVAGNP